MKGLNFWTGKAKIANTGTAPKINKALLEKAGYVKSVNRYGWKVWNTVGSDAESSFGESVTVHAKKVTVELPSNINISAQGEHIVGHNNYNPNL